MRNSIISDPDGSVEYNKVSLTPSNWAWLAQQKASGQPRGETAESLTYKIARLEKINILLKGMIAVCEPSRPLVSADSCGLESIFRSGILGSCHGYYHCSG